MTAPVATDWAGLLVGPAWQAFLVVVLAAAALLLLMRQPVWLQKLMMNGGISRISLLGIEVELAEAYKERDQNPPGPGTLQAFSILSRRLEPVVRGRGVLWIDDNPDGNRHEVELLRRLGVQVNQVRSTAQALARLKEPTMPIDLVIADYARPDDTLATGAAVIATLRDAGFRVPIVFYVGDASPDRRAEAAAAGAVGLTAAPDELLKLTLVELSINAR
jgi:CheY-like chemotaxis protein